MSVYSGPEIVNSGLVLHLDAANPRSYPGTGTAWNDLSGNGNNGTLLNNVGYSTNNNGTMIFDSVNDYASIQHNVNLDPSLAMTLSSWVKLTNFVSVIPIFGKGNTSTGFDLRIESSNQLNLVKYGVVDQTITITTGLITNTWYNISAIQYSDRVEYYINGINVGSFSDSRQYRTTTTEFRIARIRIGNSTDFYFPGNISTIFYYNRILTAAEIQQNFEALRGRYNI